MRFLAGDATFIVLANLPASIQALVVVLARVDTGLGAQNLGENRHEGLGAHCLGEECCGECCRGGDDPAV